MKYGLLQALRTGARARFSASVVLSMTLAVCVVQVVSAIDGAKLSIERIEGAGWTAHDVTVDIEMPETKASSRINVGRIALGDSGREARNVSIECSALELTAVLIACKNAQVTAVLPEVGRQQLQGRVVYQRQTGAIDLDVRATSLLGGRTQLRAHVGEQGWNLSARFEQIDAGKLLGLTRRFTTAVPEMTATGRMTLDLTASGADSVSRAQWSASFAELTANNASGTLASDKLSFTSKGSMRAGGSSGWTFDTQLDAGGGQVYFDPVFLDFGVHAAALRASGALHTNGAITIREFGVQHDGVMSASGSAQIDRHDEQLVRDLDLNVGALHFPAAYESYMQPFLLDSNFKALATTGRVAAQVVIANGVPQRAQLALHDLNMDDGTKRLVLQAVNGTLDWRADDDTRTVLSSDSPRSSLSWRGGSLLGLSVGASRLQFTALGRDVRLLEPARIPLLDGSVDFESLRVRNVGLPSVAFMVDANIQPISVADVCRAFEWPEFGGTIGGSISKLRLREGVLTLGTTLQANVFDGRVAISDLRLEDAFGKWPRLYSSIALEKLDLELVTRAFSFGRITGRLSGAINELQLFNWQPVAFDANLFTPPDDRSRHRISQRAVENIGSIGGGGAGITQALSSGFLKFFDDFRYERLGLSCRLENDVCHMNGVAPAPNGGYYLVKGSGLPRIDVIGGARRVDWPRLVNQLIAITESEGPVVK